MRWYQVRAKARVMYFSVTGLAGWHCERYNAQRTPVPPWDQYPWTYGADVPENMDCLVDLLYELLDRLYEETGESGIVRDQFVAEQLMNALGVRLLAGDFKFVDDFMTALDVNRIAPAAVISALTITFHGKDQLKNRTAFLERAEASLRVRLGDSRTDQLLETRR